MRMNIKWSARLLRVYDTYFPDEFKSHFRMTRETCELFLKLAISAVVLAILREQSCSSI